MLLAIHPKGINRDTQEAISNFVLEGGKLILFSDPMAETDPVTPDPSQPNILPNLESNPSILLENLGVSMKKGIVLGNEEVSCSGKF